MKVEIAEAFKCSCDGCGHTVVLAECPIEFPVHWSSYGGIPGNKAETEAICLENRRLFRLEVAEGYNRQAREMRVLWARCADSALWAAAVDEHAGWQKDPWHHRELLWILQTLVRFAPKGEDPLDNEVDVTHRAHMTCYPETSQAGSLVDHYIERCIRKIGHPETRWPYVEVYPETPVKEMKVLAHNAWMSPEVVQ